MEKVSQQEGFTHGATESPDQASKEKLVFLGGLPLTLTRSDMSSYLEQFGPVERLILPVNLDTGLLKGHGKAVFATKKGRDHAIAQKQHVLKGVPFGITPWVDPAHYYTMKNEESKRKVFVKHKSKHQEADLLRYFRQFGVVTRLDLRKNHHNNKPRNFGYVYFQDSESAAALLALQRHQVQGLSLECRPCVPSEREIEQQETALYHIQLRDQLALSAHDPCHNRPRPQNMQRDTFDTGPPSKQTSKLSGAGIRSAQNRTSKIFGTCHKNGHSHQYEHSTPLLDSKKGKPQRHSAASRRFLAGDEEHIKPTSTRYSAAKLSLIASSHLLEHRVLFRISLPKMTFRGEFH